MSAPEFHAAASADMIDPDSSIAVDIAGQSILLCHSDGQFFAVANRCSHADEPLTCGRIKHGWVACPAHGARFDLETGEALNPPASAAIATFPVKIAAGTVYIGV